jgi:hypothetical protein
VLLYETHIIQSLYSRYLSPCIIAYNLWREPTDSNQSNTGENQVKMLRLLHRIFSFINGIVTGSIIGIAALLIYSDLSIALYSVVSMAGTGALVGSVYSGFKWLSGILGGITGGLLAVAFAIAGIPPVPGFDNWVISYTVVVIVVPLLPTVGR